MPLLDGSQVSPLPLPSQLSSLSPDTDVWSISQTAEIFIDYESYANRYLFYSLPLFRPNPPSASASVADPSSTCRPMSFFDALTVEQDQLDAQIRSQFPSQLKPRLLASLLDPLAQREPTIDRLVSYLYRLYHNRFDVDEKVIVDLSFNQPPSASSTVYSAKVVRVFPPKPIRDLDKNAYADLIHLQTTVRRQLPLAQALEIDDAKAYLYTIQLMDDDQARVETEVQEDHFGASYMEVEPRKLSRHPDSFSRALLKKFIQSALMPYSSSRSHPRWAIHPHILHQYNISNTTPVPALSAKAAKPLTKPPKRRTPLPAIPSPPEPKKRKKVLPGPPATAAAPVRPPPSYQDYLHHSALLLAHPSHPMFSSAENTFGKGMPYFINSPLITASLLKTCCLKILNVAARMTSIDLARASGCEPGAYRQHICIRGPRYTVWLAHL